MQGGDAFYNALQQLAELIQRTDKTVLRQASTSEPSVSPPNRLARSPRVQNSSAPPRVQHNTAEPRVQEGTTSLSVHPNVASPPMLQKPPPIVPPILTAPTPTKKISPSVPLQKYQSPITRTKSRRYNRRSFSQGTNFKNLASQFLTAQMIYENMYNINALQHEIHHIFDEYGNKQSLDALLIGPTRDIWEKALSNELGRLTRGNIHGVTFTECMKFIAHTQVPNNKKVTYANFVCDHRPLKAEPWRVRLVVGGDKLEYSLDSGSPTTTLLETKLLVNSVISDADKNARFACCDIKDFFLASPMTSPEYMRIHRKYLPADIIKQYNLEDLFHNDYVYCRIDKGMYGLKQAAILAYQQLCQRLKGAGYYPVLGSAGIFAHQTRQTKFCLCVDDFGIKYYSKADLDHLLKTLGQHYQYSVDITGTDFCGLHYVWNYAERYVDVSLPLYIQKALKRFNHKPKNGPQYAPHHHIPVRYSQKGERQYATQDDNSPPLSPKDAKWVQSVIGSFLYYCRALDCTIATTLNDLARQQSKPTTNTRSKCHRLMDYLATYPNAYIRYHASDMILHIDSDAAYLVLPEAKSRIAGFYQLTNTARPNTPSFTNGPLLVECKTLRHVVSSAAEAETSALYHNAQNAIHIRRLLHQLGHPQPPTPIKVDNSTTAGFVHKNINQRRSKSWDMRFHWLRDKATQRQIRVFWDSGKNNLADYPTKHHTAPHHKKVRPYYIRDMT